MRRFRFKLGTLMIAVILMGGAVWGVEMRRRSASYSAQVAYHVQEVQKNEKLFGSLVRCGTWGGSTDEENEAIQKCVLKSVRDRSEYHGLMKDKYQHAAAHPWDRVDPDPPEPEFVSL